jgi:hypothetical protein
MGSPNNVGARLACVPQAWRIALICAVEGMTSSTSVQSTDPNQTALVVIARSRGSRPEQAHSLLRHCYPLNAR